MMLLGRAPRAPLAPLAPLAQLARGALIALSLGLAFALALPSCSSPDDPLAEAEIGVAGGSLSVVSGSYAGTSITIAPNSVTETILFQIWSRSSVVLSGWVAIGPAAQFAPKDFALAATGTVILPYDPTALPTGTAGADLRVVARASDGTVDYLAPTLVDAMTGVVSTPLDRLATMWVVVPDRIVSADYLPLGVGDEYVFDFTNDNKLRVDDATMDQGVTADRRLTFLLPWFHRSGIYLDENAMGGIDFVGLIDSPPQMLATADINDMVVPFLDPIETVGSSHVAAFTYKTYSIDLNNPPPTETATGTGMLAIDVLARETVDTAVGRFLNTVVVGWTETWSDTSGASGSGTIKMWLAEDVGPVQIQIGTDAPGPLRSATVGGRPVSGS